MTVSYSIMYVYKFMYQQYSYMKTCIIYLYMYCKNNSVDVSSQNSQKFGLQHSSPIVLIKVSTIVLKEGRSERGYNPETPCNFS